MTIVRTPSFADIELPGDAVVIIDDALPESWAASLQTPTSQEAIRVEAGEGLKSLFAVERLAGQVLKRRSTRPLTIVAIGGGSVGDAVGFLASVLWRGVALWHVPTTLLAMVDSAHGGKTAVNLGEAKNQLGTFYPAQRTLLVEEALRTLPLKQRRDGLVELVKALWLGDAAALDLLEEDGAVGDLAAATFDDSGDRLMALLQRAIDVKLGIVERDEFETQGVRVFLNLGHTAAHALELHTGVSHGQAVAWGMTAASFLSAERGDFSASDAARLRRHLHPLITPSSAIHGFAAHQLFCDTVGRDKKTVGGRLRSVLLRGPGEPFVTTDVTADDWFDAFRRAVDWFENTSVRAERRLHRCATLDVEASKSEMNRSLVIEHLRPAPTEVIGQSSADDVVWLRSCLTSLRDASGRTEIYCGEGGTTFRFLLAVAAARDGETVLFAAPRLLQRPHDPLLNALREGGASIEPVEEGGRVGFHVRGWSNWPASLTVSARVSSQYATALALLSATGESFSLHLETDGEVASRPYFEMTLELLRMAGICVESLEEGAGYTFSPTPALSGPATIRVDTDASSAAVWAFARLLDVDAEVAQPPLTSRQPDGRAARIAATIANADANGDDQGDERMEIDLGESPDLAPVLCAAATQLRPAIDIIGAEHLRHKESDRIGDLAHAFSCVGIEITPRPDGLSIPGGPLRPQSGASWPTFGDHRLAMAGLLVSTAAPILIESPMVVAKSYPDFWHHARQLGWSIEPVEE